MSNQELKIVYDSEGRAIVDKEMLDLLLKEHEELAAKQAEVSNLRQRLHWIWAIGVDYDGYKGSAEDLEDLIDEMVEFTQMSDEQVDDQLKAVKQLQQSLIELSAQKAELINQVQRLKKYDKERDERLHARLSEAAYDKGSKDTADRIYSYLYFLNKDNTENPVDKMFEWIKNTFGV
jgi:DNA repair exonuclease SbcCD ATPase subunit